MTTDTFLINATKKLTTVNIDSARLDALILLEDALGKDRALLLAHPELVLTSAQITVLEGQIAERQQHIPLAYIRGKTTFYGRNFTVNKDVLVPRPESESIITLLKEVTLPKALRLADIGTGSGCLGITAALELHGAKVDLYDKSAAALACAKINAGDLGASTHFYQENLLAHAFDKDRPQYDALLANLPYVPSDYAINKAATYEPELALFAGADGLNLYRRFWESLRKQTRKPLYVLTESLISQHQAIATMALTAGYTLEKTETLVQRFAIAS